MLLAPDKKIILRCFFQLKVICLCAKFYAYPTPATCFLPKNVTFLTYLQWQYFSFNFCRVFHHSKVEFSDLDQNWARNMPLLFKTFKLPNSMAWHIVHCCRIDSFRVLRQSFYGKFQIVCGFWNPANPTFRMYD